MAKRLGNANPAVAAPPNRENLEGAIKAFHNWRTVVSAGTFKGHEAVHVGHLIAFLDDQHKAASDVYESAFPKNVSFERPPEVKP